MNKKFLSAILFGAMMATSAGTFVSCKDYDDDIKGLQEQIDTNKTAIAELQKLVGSGKWVTSVAASGENLVVTMSDGSSVTVAGIKGADGVDGKNAAEWTIGEDGFWYVDGEKTANLAVAQNGKDGVNGLTAPSPKIENGVWVVYNWDAEKGEFVEEVTEISAAGTSSFVVLKNGVYTLNIADENGEFVEIALPATAESFTTNGISNANVNVVFTYGKWKTPAVKTEKELFDKLAAEFPELKEYKDKDLVEQGGKLPFIVSPANVELTKEHTFALVDMKGKDAGATLSNPTKGMPEGLETVETNGVLNSRTASGSAVWSVDFTPALNKKADGYVKNENVLYSLVVSGPKGIISATPYVYKYSVAPTQGVYALNGVADLSKKYNENGIDIFVGTEDDKACVCLPETTLRGMYLLEATDPAQVEEYGISIAGSVVTIADMPKGKDTDAIKLQITAIEVDGSVATKGFTLTVTNDVAATGALADLEETLTGTYKNGKFSTTKQTFWWSLEDLELSALQLNKFIAATNKKLTITEVVDEGTPYQYEDASLKIYADDKKTEVTSENYTEAAYIKAELDAKTVLPGNYEVVLTAGDATTTILKAVSGLTLTNPEEDLLTIKESYLDEEGVVIAATLNSTSYQFNLNNIFSAEAASTIASYTDLDWEYDNSINKWMNTAEGFFGIIKDAKLAATNAEGEFVSEDVDQVRSYKVVYNLFGNSKNQKEIEFKVKWTSSIYAEDATDVITMTPAKLKIKFDDTTPSTKVNQIDFKAITSAIYAQGSLKGQAYKLFGKAESDPTNTTVTYYDYTSGATLTLNDIEYMSTGEKYVDVRVEDMIALGYGEDDLLNAQNNGKAFKLKKEDFEELYAKVSDGEDKNGKGLLEWKTNNDFDAYRPVATATNIADATLKKQYEMFVYYAGLIKFNNSFDITTSTEADDAEDRAKEINSIVFDCVNEADEAYISTASDHGVDIVNGYTLKAQVSSKIDITSLVEGKKVIPMKMTVTDVWGKVMVYEFEVEISL